VFTIHSFVTRINLYAIEPLQCQNQRESTYQPKILGLTQNSRSFPGFPKKWESCYSTNVRCPTVFSFTVKIKKMHYAVSIVVHIQLYISTKITTCGKSDCTVNKVVTALKLLTCWRQVSVHNIVIEPMQTVNNGAIGTPVKSRSYAQQTLARHSLIYIIHVTTSNFL